MSKNTSYAYTHEELLRVSTAAMVGILSDQEDLPRIKRDGKLLSCEDSVSVRAVSQAKSLMNEVWREK